MKPRMRIPASFLNNVHWKYAIYTVTSSLLSLCPSCIRRQTTKILSCRWVLPPRTSINSHGNVTADEGRWSCPHYYLKGPRAVWEQSKVTWCAHAKFSHSGSLWSTFMKISRFSKNAICSVKFSVNDFNNIILHLSTTLCYGLQFD